MGMTLPVAKTRVEYIDIARVLAAFIIILYHSAIVGDSNYVYASAFLFGRLPFFFVLAGFFLRDPSWSGMRRRLSLLVIPYLIWEFVPMTICSQSHLIPADFRLGYWDLVERGLVHFPFNFPLWFLRDLIIYTALYPLLYPFRRYVGYVALLLFILLAFDILPLAYFTELKHPCSIKDFAFFLAGIALQPIGIAGVTRFLEKHAGKILLLGGLVNIYIYVQLFTTGPVGTLCFLQMLGILMLLSCSFLLSKHLPKLSHILLQVAPATYLIFLTHALLYFPIRVSVNQPWYQDYHYIINPIVSLLIMLAAIYAVKGMRSYCPILLPFLAGINTHKH